MDFGGIPKYREFDASLAEPKVHIETEVASGFANEVNPPSTENPRPLILTGAPQWGVPSWVGRVYPEKTPARDFLHHYSRQWDSIELNSSFYRVPDRAQVAKWRDETPPHFRFIVKAFQGLSHELAGTRSRESIKLGVRSFLGAWSALGDRLDRVFLQLPPDFQTSDGGPLKALVSAWDPAIPLSIEFRHPSWFDGPDLNERYLKETVLQFLNKNGIGTVITDSPGRREVSHGSITSGAVMVRFLTQTDEAETAILPRDLERLDSWVEWLGRAIEQGAREVRFFVHSPDEFWLPEISREFVGRWNKVHPECPVKGPVELEQPQMGLFE